MRRPILILVLAMIARCASSQTLIGPSQIRVTTNDLPALTASTNLTWTLQWIANAVATNSAVLNAVRSNTIGFASAPATYNSDLSTIDVSFNDGTVGQMFKEMWVTVKNVSGSTISNGQVVCGTSASGYHFGAQLASNTGTLDNALSIIGVATINITNNSVGKITMIGNVNDINTIGYPENSRLWLSSTPGHFQTNMPAGANERRICLGTVLREHSTQGRISVHVQNIPKIDDVFTGWSGVITNVLNASTQRLWYSNGVVTNVTSN